MRALFRSYNLLGDSLQTTPSLKAWAEEYKSRNPEIVLNTNDDYIQEVYKRIGVPLTVTTDPDLDDSSFEFVFNFDISRAFSLGATSNIPASLCFAAMLGMKVKSTLPIFNLTDEEDKQARKDAEKTPLILFHPYSISCSSWTSDFANKRWSDENWTQIWNWINQDFGISALVLGGKESKKEYPIPGIPYQCHQFGLSLGSVAALQKHATFILTLDNGAAHLAASQNAHLLELYPSCLPEQWMANLENPNGQIIHWRPAELPADYVYAQMKPRIEERLKEGVCAKN